MVLRVTCSEQTIAATDCSGNTSNSYRIEAIHTSKKKVESCDAIVVTVGCIGFEPDGGVATIMKLFRPRSATAVEVVWW
ncbi:hypothetical protein HanIR_Chr03g0103601 [Helianthus annuus]|nr:hypothetical protein HanIR_Chr03g0103601 [Helianthus annuus]